MQSPNEVNNAWSYREVPRAIDSSWQDSQEAIGGLHSAPDISVVPGRLRPSALAVLRLIMSSNLVGEIKRWKLAHEVGDAVGWVMRMNATSFQPSARSPGDNPGFEER